MEAGVALVDGLALRKTGGDPPLFAFGGVPVDEATFTSPVVRMTGLLEVFGLTVLVADPTGGLLPSAHVSVQATIDGETYLTWDGAEWVPAAEDGDYTAVPDFNEACSALAIPDVGGTLGFRVRLEALDKDPTLIDFTPYVEWDHHLQLDWMTAAREVSNTRTRVERRTKLGAVADTYLVQDAYSPDTTLPAQVFNLTEDPDRVVDLFDSWGADNTIQLVAEQAVDSVLLIRFQGTARRTIAQRDELVDVSVLPHTVIRLESMEELEVQNVGVLRDLKLGTETRLSRERFHPRAMKLEVTISHWADRPQEALRGLRSLRRAFESLASPQTGATWRMVLTEREALEPRQGSGIFGGTLRADIYALDFSAEYQEEQLVNQLHILQGANGRTRSRETVTISAT